MASACVTMKTNAYLANSRKDNTFIQDNGFFGERVKGGLSYSPWIINQLATRVRTKERRIKKAKPAVVSAVLTSNTTKEAVVGT